MGKTTKNQDSSDEESEDNYSDSDYEVEKKSKGNKKSKDADDESDYEVAKKTKISLKRKGIKDTKSKNIKKPTKKTPTKTSKDKNSQKKEPAKKVKKQKDDDDDEEEKMDSDDEEEDLIMPGQKYRTPPDGDASRIFYSSLYKQNSNSRMAEKWLLEYGLLDKDKAKEVLKKMEREKLNKKKQAYPHMYFDHFGRRFENEISFKNTSFCFLQISVSLDDQYVQQMKKFQE